MKGHFLASQAILALVCCLALSSRATTYTNSSPGYWTNNASWTGTPLSLATNDDTGVILLRAMGPTTTTLTNNFTTVVLNRLMLDTNRNTVLLGAGTLVFTNDGAAVQNNSPNSLTINEAIRITSTTLFRTTNSGNTIVNSNITGSGSIVISNTGTGMIRLSGSNSFSGGLTLAAGLLDLRNASALGTGAFTIGPSGAGSMSTQFLDSTIATTIATTNNQFWNAGFTFLGSAALALSPGTVTLGTNVTVTVAASTLTVPGAITGGYALVKSGAGTLVVAGASTLPSMTVSAGTLQLGNSATTATNVLGTGILTNNGRVILAGNGGTALYSNLFTGSGSLLITNGIIAYLSASNDYSGGTYLSGSTGRLAAGNDNALGTGALYFLIPTGGGSALSSTGNSARTIANSLVFSNHATLGNGSTDPGLLNLTGNGDLAGGIRQLTISSPVILAGMLSNGGITKLGTGTLTLSNSANSYALGTTNSAGTLVLGADHVLGSGDLVMNGGALVSVGGYARTVTNALRVIAATVLDTTSGDLAFSGGFTNTATLAKSGSGTLTFLNTPSGFGNTLTISNGLVRFVGSATTFGGGGANVLPGTSLIADNASPVTIGSGTWANFGTSVFSNLVTISAGGTFITSTNGALNGFVGGLRNQGVLTVISNATVNVGGLDQDAALGSTLTLTNSSTGTISVGSAGFMGSLNASTSTVGVLNQGILQVQQSGVGSTGLVNATVVNDVGGQVRGQTGAATAILSIERMPTNLGLITSQRGAIVVRRGDLYNGGTLQLWDTSPSLTLSDGVITNSLINGATGLVTLETGTGSGTYIPFVVAALVNQGLMVLTNQGQATYASIHITGVLTNNGTTVILRTNGRSGNLYESMRATSIVNNGAFVGVSRFGDLVTNNQTVNYIASPFVNALGGSVISSNQGVFVFDNLQNAGTLLALSNSVLGIGAAGSVDMGNRIVAGTSPFRNAGTIELQDGVFAASLLTNNAGATLQGRGQVGQIAISNIVSGAITNLARFFSARGIVNSGLIAPDGGVLNAGAITNANGASIVGSGEIQSFDRTNYYSGETFIATNLNTGNAVANLANATVLADTGTLTLQNGFSRNTQAGTVGTTNGGTLRLGDGTLVLTNSGTVRLQGGALQVGSLVNSGNLVGTGAVQAGTVASSGRIIPGSSPGTLSFSNDLTLLSGSWIELEISGTNWAAYDHLDVGGTFTKAGSIFLTNPGWSLAAGDTFDFWDAAAINGSFLGTNSWVLPSLGEDLYWDTSLFEAQGILSVMAIPEPSAAFLVLLAAAGALAFRRRK